MEQKNQVEKDSFRDYLKEIPNFLSFFIVSVFYNIASLMLIDMSKSTGIKTTDINLVFTFVTIGSAVGQLTSILFNRRFTKIQVIIAGYILLMPFILIAVFNSYIVVFYVVYLVCGYIFGVIWIQTNEFVLESKIKNKDRLITIVLIFFPIGALVSPFISSSIIKSGFDWRFSYYIIIFLIGINISLYILLLGRRKSIFVSCKTEKVVFKGIFTNKITNLVFLLIVLSIVFYVCSETIIATWAPTFFRFERGFDIQSAGFLLTLFWIFIAIGRGISLILIGKIHSIKIMIALACIAIIAVSVMVFIKKEYLIYLLSAITGLGYSALYPLLISTGSTLYEKGRGMLATILFVGANIGGASAPFLTKYLSSKSLVLSLGFAPVIMALVFLFLITALVLHTRQSKVRVTND